MAIFAGARLGGLPRSWQLAAGFVLCVGCGGDPSGPGPALTGTTPPGEVPAMQTPPGGTIAPGQGVPMRRLTREQYQNTVRDLLGVHYPATQRFAADELLSGFRTNTTLAVQELHLEQYQAAAEEIAEQVGKPELVAALAPCAQGSDPVSCARNFIEQFGRRAYRRPLTPAETDRLLGVYTVGQKAGFAAGIELVIAAALQSPRFLYRPEFGTGALSNWLTPYEMASRLSYLLWNTTPDEALFAAASAGELMTVESAASHAARMLADERASAMWSSFADQWLGTDGALTIERDPAKYPGFSPELRVALAAQTGRFFDAVARRGDGLLSTLLTSSRAPLSPPLFELYGLGPASGAADAWQDVELPPGERAGLLTLAPFMATNAHADQTSLVRRGFMIRTKLLCTVPPPPPPDVDADVPAVDPSLTARERFALHRSNPVCAGCHALMDPLGLPFELYDALGRYRTVEGTRPIDASGELTGTGSQDGVVSGPLELVGKLAAADEVAECVTKQFFRYAFGRVESDGDETTLAALTESFRANNRHLATLLAAMASSDAFRAGPAL